MKSKSLVKLIIACLLVLGIVVVLGTKAMTSAGGLYGGYGRSNENQMQLAGGAYSELYYGCPIGIGPVFGTDLPFGSPQGFGTNPFGHISFSEAGTTFRLDSTFGYITNSGTMSFAPPLALEIGLLSSLIEPPILKIGPPLRGISGFEPSLSFVGISSFGMGPVFGIGPILEPTLSSGSGLPYDPGLLMGFNLPPEIWHGSSEDKTPKEYGPKGIPLDEVSEIAFRIAMESHDSTRDSEEDSEWENTELASEAYPIFNPAIDDDSPAYIEFKVISEHSPKDRGYILVSLTEDDFPILEYATEGITNTEYLYKKAKSSDLKKIVRYDAIYMTAENEEGEKVAHIGPEPVQYPDEILNYEAQIFEHELNEQGEIIAPSILPEFTGKPYESYQIFKDNYVNSEPYIRYRELQQEKALEEWDLYYNLLNIFNIEQGLEQPIVIEGKNVIDYSIDDSSVANIQISDSGLLINSTNLGSTILHLYFEDGEETDYLLNVSKVKKFRRRLGDLHSDTLFYEPCRCSAGEYTPWTYHYAGTGSDQRRYHQESCGSCKCGCGPVAWAMLYGWFDYKGYADLIDGIAPLYLNDNVRDCISNVRHYVDSYCVGSQAATNPWDMIDGIKWAQNDRGAKCYGSITWILPWTQWLFGGKCTKKVKESIIDFKSPSIIGLGYTSMHYCLAYGYKSRTYTYRCYGSSCSWLRKIPKIITQRLFKVNWGDGSGNYKWIGDKLWFASKLNFSD